MYYDYRSMVKTMDKKFIKINKQIMQRIVSNGRITIPGEIRDVYNLKDGDMMEILVLGYYQNNGNKNYQAPESGEERTIQGGNKHEQMADKTAPESNSKGLDDPEREPHKSNNEGTRNKKQKIESIGGKDEY